MFGDLTYQYILQLVLPSIEYEIHLYQNCVWIMPDPAVSFNLSGSKFSAHTSQFCLNSMQCLVSMCHSIWQYLVGYIRSLDNY